MSIVTISASRTLTDYEIFLQGIKESGFQIDFLVHGAHWEGGDTLAQKYADETGLTAANKCLRCPAEWKLYGKPAGVKRNFPMVNIAEKVLVFWDGESKGAKSVIDYAKRQGKELFIKMTR